MKRELDRDHLRCVISLFWKQKFHPSLQRVKKVLINRKADCIPFKGDKKKKFEWARDLPAFE